MFNALERAWKGFKFLSKRPHFQICYADVSPFLHSQSHNDFLTLFVRTQQMFQGIWEDQNVASEGRWPRSLRRQGKAKGSGISVSNCSPIHPPGHVEWFGLEGKTWDQEHVYMKNKFALKFLIHVSHRVDC